MVQHATKKEWCYVAKGSWSKSTLMALSENQRLLLSHATHKAVLHFVPWLGCCQTGCDMAFAAGSAASPAAPARQSSSSAPTPQSLQSLLAGGQMGTAVCAHGEGGVSSIGGTLYGHTLTGAGLCLLGNGRFHCTLDILRSSANRNTWTMNHYRTFRQQEFNRRLFVLFCVDVLVSAVTGCETNEHHIIRQFLWPNK